QGSGALTLTGASSYTGPTNINAGALVVNGSLASSVFVNSGWQHRQPRRRQRRRALARQLDRHAYGERQFGDGFGRGLHRRGIVLGRRPDQRHRPREPWRRGTAHVLSGTVAHAYTILSAAGGLNGTTFGALTTTNLPANFTPSLSYTATDVILNFTARLGGPGLSINQQNVATALNSFFNNGGALTHDFVSAFGLPGGNLVNALTLLSGEAATGGSALRPSATSCPTTSHSRITKYSRRRRSRRRSTSAGACGAQATAEATARLVIPCLSAALICPRAPRAAPPGSIIASRRARWWAWRSPAAAPIGPWRRGSAAARAMRFKPDSTARHDGARPMSRPRSPTPITGCRPTVPPLPAIISPRASTPR